MVDKETNRATTSAVPPSGCSYSKTRRHQRLMFAKLRRQHSSSEPPHHRRGSGQAATMRSRRSRVEGTNVRGQESHQVRRFHTVSTCINPFVMGQLIASVIDQRSSKGNKTTPKVRRDYDCTCSGGRISEIG